jgi:hypothetical protein
VWIKNKSLANAIWKIIIFIRFSQICFPSLASLFIPRIFQRIKKWSILWLPNRTLFPLARHKREPKCLSWKIGFYYDLKPGCHMCWINIFWIFFSSDMKTASIIKDVFWDREMVEDEKYPLIESQIALWKISQLIFLCDTFAASTPFPTKSITFGFNISEIKFSTFWIHILFLWA